MAEKYKDGQKYKDGILVTAKWGSSGLSLENITDKENNREYKVYIDKKDKQLYYIKNKVKHYLMWG